MTAAATHQVGSHHVEVFPGRLDENHLRAAGAQLPGLAAQAASRCAPRDGRHALGRIPGLQRVQRGGGIEADHEVEPLAAQQVEVRVRVHAAVHVAATADLDRVVEAGDRARGGHGLRQLGGGRALAAERHAAPAGVVTRHHPVVRVVAPAVRDHSLDRPPQRVGRDHSARQPACHRCHRGVLARPGERAQNELRRTGSDRRQRTLELEHGAPRAVRLGGRAAVGVHRSVEGLARGVGHHEPRRHTGRA